MKFLFIAGAIIILCYIILRYMSLKNHKKDTLSLSQAYLRKDYEEYLRIIDYKISHSRDVKDKNILGTLKIQSYLWQRDWEKIEGLYRQIQAQLLPKKVKLTFFCHYLTALYLSGQGEKARSFRSQNQSLWQAGQGHSDYQLYLTAFTGFAAYEEGNYEKAEKLFASLVKQGQGSDFYREVFSLYLSKATAALESGKAVTGAAE